MILRGDGRLQCSTCQKYDDNAVDEEFYTVPCRSCPQLIRGVPASERYNDLTCDDCERYNPSPGAKLKKEQWWRTERIVASDQAWSTWQRVTEGKVILAELDLDSHPLAHLRLITGEAAVQLSHWKYWCHVPPGGTYDLWGGATPATGSLCTGAGLIPASTRTRT